MTQPQARAGAPLSLLAVLAFATANIPISAVTLAVSVHLPKYFASSVGLTLGAVGAAFGLVRLIDIPIDALLGLAMDRTRTRMGRYRPWVLAGAPVMMLGLFMLMRAGAGAGVGFLVTWLLVMYLGLSMTYLAHLAWASNLAPTYEQRSRTMGAITFLGVAGAVIALLIPVVVDARGGGEASGVKAMIWFIIVAAPATALLACLMVGERIPADRTSGFRLGDYAALLKRGNVIRLLLADLLFNLGPMWMAALYLFYFTDHRGFTTGQANLLLLAYLAAGFLGAPLTAWLANRIGKHRALMVNTTVYSLSLLAIPFYPPGAFLMALPGMVAAGAMYTGFIVSIRALTGDIADEVRLETGREWMGLMYAMVNVTSKVAAAFAILLTFNVLEQIGYQAAEGAVNTAQALAGLQWAFLSGPIVFVILGGACFIGYRLDARRHAQIRAELDAREALALSAGEGFAAAPVR
ncbi:MFS transporter [Phenylobacterium deserti]|uniref:MFS transporter n=1 Tax=Phenylobacterium deserti TaxID=1914756 RepID=A0A328ANK8_9CAUL|nr:MFS transporter [Phenylobacterium deserti]RAK56602.1 MFS transporter [Phenylobacterium deserti]